MISISGLVVIAKMAGLWQYQCSLQPLPLTKQRCNDCNGFNDLDGWAVVAAKKMAKEVSTRTILNLAWNGWDDRVDYRSWDGWDGLGWLGIAAIYGTATMTGMIGLCQHQQQSESVNHCSCNGWNTCNGCNGWKRSGCNDWFE